jgi:hypothetical protein
MVAAMAGLSPLENTLYGRKDASIQFYGQKKNLRIMAVILLRHQPFYLTSEAD